MTNKQRMINDMATIDKREIADKIVKDERIRNDDLTMERRIKADKLTDDHRLKNDELTANRREMKDGNNNTALVVSLLVLLFVVGTFVFLL